MEPEEKQIQNISIGRFPAILNIILELKDSV